MNKRGSILAHISFGLTACLSITGILWAASAGIDPARSARESKRGAEWKVPEIFGALAIRPGNRIADIGCGDGFLTLRLASSVGPDGRVFAVDIDDRALGALRRRIKEDGAGNVEVIKGEAANPLLAPLSLDGAVILRAYHEFSAYREMLAAVRAALRPGGRLVIADVGPGDADLERSRQVASHVLSHRIVENDLAEAGFQIVRSVPSFARLDSGETVWLVAAERPGAARNDAAHARVFRRAEHIEWEHRARLRDRGRRVAYGEGDLGWVTGFEPATFGTTIRRSTT